MAKRAKWVDVVSVYIDEIDGYFLQAKCTKCKLYSACYCKYGVHFWNEYCSHCGVEMEVPKH